MIKKFASWNGYPKNIVNAIIKLLSKYTSTSDAISNEEKDKIPTVFINIDYPGEKGEHLLKRNVLRVWDSPLIKKVSFVCRYPVMKKSIFTNMKDKLEMFSKSNVAYQFSCPGCASSYVGKT